MSCRTTTFALLAAAAVAFARAARAEEDAPQPKITGSVVCRERIALPPDAIVRVRLEAAPAPEKTAKRVAEITIPAQGRQLPIPFELPYEASDIQPQQRYLVRATITAGDKTLFVSPSPYPVITKGAPTKLEILVQQAGVGRKPRPVASTTSVGLSGTNWRLVTLGEVPAAALPEAQQASLLFDGRRKRISGSTGCNRFMGTYAPGEGSGLKLEPSGMTMMACPEDVTKQEKAFLDALRATTGYRIAGAKLELLAGDRVLARFEPGAGGAARSD
jgi:putative lipoprotein